MINTIEAKTKLMSAKIAKNIREVREEKPGSG
jgi:hypothetical protein